MESPTMWALSIFSASSTARMSSRARSREFMHEDDRNARPAVLVVELHVVIGGQMRHRSPLSSRLRHIGHAVSDGSWDACPSNCYSGLGLEDRMGRLPRVVAVALVASLQCIGPV